MNLNIQSIKNKLGLTALIAVSTFAGAAGGVTLFSAAAAHAQSITPAVVTAQTATPTASSSPSVNQGQPSGTFHSNEDPTHEKGESAAREAQEDAGIRPTAQ
jgi:hypothetical protein